MCKVNGKKVVSTRGKKEKASNAKIMNRFHATVMIVMDARLNDAYLTRGRSNRKRGQLFIFCLPHSL
jgi:hypothetical protein